MSYIGNQPPDIGAYDFESFDGGGTSFTLKRAATVSSVLLFIDGVRQTPTDAYTVSGVTLTTTGTTPSGTDNVTVMFMGDVVDIGAPSSDTVSTAKIQDDAVTTDKILDDAVTADKLANSINTEIAANTAKVTNATHTGDVTGATALTIAADAVDIAMLSATGTADATTFLRGDNAWAAASYTNPNTVSGCHVTLSGSQSIAGSSYVKILLDTETWDLGGEFASNKFTVTTAGRYFVIVQTHIGDMASDKKLQNFIYKNGSDVCNARNNTSSAGHLTAITTTVLSLAASDYIESYVYNGDSSARNAISGAGTYMMIQRIT
jgi:hypothetical protein